MLHVFLITLLLLFYMKVHSPQVNYIYLDFLIITALERAKMDSDTWESSILFSVNVPTID